METHHILNFIFAISFSVSNKPNLNFQKNTWYEFVKLEFRSLDFTKLYYITYRKDQA